MVQVSEVLHSTSLLYMYTVVQGSVFLNLLLFSWILVWCLELELEFIFTEQYHYSIDDLVKCQTSCSSLHVFLCNLMN